MAKKEVRREVPDEFHEFLQFLDTEKVLELTYLNIARAIVTTREKLHLSPDHELQVLLLYADGAILENMVIDMADQYPDLKIKVVSKPLSTAVFFDIQVGPNLEQNWSKSEAGKLFTQIMLEDNRLGTFDPELPTLWIDQAIQFSAVREVSQYPEVPIGKPALFFSIYYIDTSMVNKGRFQEVFSPEDFLDVEDPPMIIRLEGLTRLPIEKSAISFDKSGLPQEATLTFDPEREENSWYYQATLWALGPEHRKRRAELLEAAFSDEKYQDMAKFLTSQAE